MPKGSKREERKMIRSAKQARKAVMLSTPILTEIVKRALTQTVCDIGQLSDVENRQLERAVKLGLLDKGKAGPYPAIKTVYACHGFNFEAAREDAIAAVEH